MVCGKCGGSVRGHIDASNTRPLCKCKPDTETIISVIRSLETENYKLKELLREIIHQAHQWGRNRYEINVSKEWLQKAKKAIGDEE